MDIAVGWTMSEVEWVFSVGAFYGGITMAGALSLLPVFLLCGLFSLISARSVGDVPAADVAFTTTRSLSSETEAPTSVDYNRSSSKPGISSTMTEHLSGK